MSDTKLHTTTFSTDCSRNSDKLLVRVSGRLFASPERPVWQSCLDRAAASEVRLDLSSVTEMDASGIGLLADFTREAQAYGRHVALVSASPRVRRLLELTRLDGVLQLEHCGPKMAA